MIPACKSPAFERLFAVYNRHLLKRSFHRISVRTDPRIDPVRPTLYAANHSSWWDALLPLELNRSLLGQELYAMMSEEGLRRFRFFRRLGAFSVDRGSLQGVKDSLRYAAGVLEGERRALWLFPQGDIRHGDVRPLGFHSGIGYLLREVPGIQVVPVSFYYCFLQDQKPEVFADLGPPIPAERLPAAASRQQLARTVEDAVTDRLDALRQGVIHGEAAGFTALLAGRSSTSDRFTRFFRRA
ncbi:lysophospholipid acyltransferase family protein [Paenibacillus mucilaginosus]|uniref:Putative phospholipid/glycerol acyltransferase n=1 Tax=Paenibacillus mucilaginosus (strain KNP414) TaxID=1036673 RepID=F8F5S7_PAEMK|nr:lysophospholipid acyltransferase family protein [Paenibacillus mucilaginosus]AEI41491.1 putative phospholipid/glycerol acyltransferase [Paenibacillus mucilaginosus KNP414]MCG7215469.1 lysophospholipid acyltransferase family protein [Paenibacillus mucilaginosus]WDM30502.1 lysophospholipid acyltransferase family protein [Paenibacillus mucilaginosus]